MQRRAQRRTFHFIYKTTCLTTGRYYIGMHSTDDLNDGYKGSGKVLRKSVLKYGKDQHQVQILEHLPDRTSLAAREKELITGELRKDPLCMNIADGGEGGMTAEIWDRRRSILKVKLDEEIAAFTMTREEILNELIQADGKLSKNATRALLKLQADRLAGQAPSIKLKKRERLVHAKWSFILSQLQNPAFKDDLVEQIDAYMLGRTARPVCKICSAPVTFFRFCQPYAMYCGSSCQLSDPSQKNPVLQRWAKYETIS